MVIAVECTWLAYARGVPIGDLSAGARSGGGALYDRLGVGYTRTRRPDPRIAHRIRAALGEPRTVLNVGAGTGSYEPADLHVVAVEPSSVMIAQRNTRERVVRADAAALPFRDDAFDVVMAVFSDQHWVDRAQGLAELRRVARHRVVLVNADPAAHNRFWMVRDYLPTFADLIPEPLRRPGAWLEELKARLGPLTAEPLPIPHDCVDGFLGAFWRRPQAYLDPNIRAGISVFPQLDPQDVARGLERLAADLESGRWAEQNRDILNRTELDLGYYIVTADVASS